MEHCCPQSHQVKVEGLVASGPTHHRGRQTWSPSSHSRREGGVQLIQQKWEQDQEQELEEEEELEEELEEGGPWKEEGPY